MTALRVGALSPLLVAVSAALAPLPCQVPKSLERVPVYAGAERQPDREQGLAAMPGMQVRVYRVQAPIEEVAKFYQQQLRAREVRTEADRDRARNAYERLAAGQVTGAVFQPSFVDLTPAHLRESGVEGDPAQRAAALRAGYAAKRAPLKPNSWLEAAAFEWGVSQGEGRYSEFYVDLMDSGAWQILAPEYKHETQIMIRVQSQGS